MPGFKAWIGSLQGDAQRQVHKTSPTSVWIAALDAPQTSDFGRISSVPQLLPRTTNINAKKAMQIKPDLIGHHSPRHARAESELLPQKGFPISCRGPVLFDEPNLRRCEKIA